jgi:DNA-directed RNA polymerase beta subunit
MIDAARQFPELMSGVQQAISRTFPIESVGHLMSIADLRWEDYGSDIKDNIALHKDYKLKGKTLAAKLHGTVEIRTKEGKVVDRVKDFILAVLPHITSRSSYIVNGHEVQTVNQLRLKPGPYTRFTVSNDTETFINAAGGGYRIVFERLAGRLLLRSGTSNIPLYPILKSLGITDREMSQAWGDEVFGANQKLDKEDALPKLYQKMRKFSDLPVGADLVTAVDSFFRSKKLDPRISKITLGKEYDQISPQLLLDASRKAVELANGNAQADDTESLAFKSIHSVEDMVPEKIDQASSSLKREIAYKMDKDPRIARLLSPASFSSPILSWFETSEFTRYSDQNNPLDMASTVNLTTTMGEGGIQSTHAVKDELRLVHPSHMGFLDPLHSPEGQKIGITGHLALGADKRGTDLIIRLYDAKTGQLVTRTPQDIENATIAFNDQYDMSGKRPRPKTPLVKAKVGYRMAIIPAAKVEYIFKDP